MPVIMRRLGVILLTAITMLAAIGALRAIPASASGSPTVSAVSPTFGPVSGRSSGSAPITRVTTPSRSTR